MEGDDDIAIKKTIGCLMILMMPKEGLDEALPSLKDMLEFYISVPKLSPLPARPTRHLTGELLSPMRRPGLAIEE
jgi:hypothetical protein